MICYQQRGDNYGQQDRPPSRTRWHRRYAYYEWGLVQTLSRKTTDNFTSKSYYQVLFDGGIKLVLKSTKTLIEIKPYNSPTTEKKFVDNAIYYVFQNNVMTKFKPSRKDFLELFKSKSAEIADFIKNENIDFKKNADLTKVFVFYNTL